MKCIIIEDEAPAAKRLKRLLADSSVDFEILATLDSIESSVAWLDKNISPDLIFMDIHLADGYSFEVFNQVEIASPVIFTTAYDEYALKAFEVNSIDYLLKPVDEKKLERSIEKLKRLKGEPGNQVNIEELIKSFNVKKAYKSRFLIKLPERLITVEESQTAYFMASGKLVLLTTRDNRHFPVDQSLDELESALDPTRFFRINRQFIAGFDSIKGIYPFFNGKLKVELEPRQKDNVFVSRVKAGAFKRWLDGER